MKNEKRIDELMSVIPYCKTRAEAEAIQSEIEELENEIAEPKHTPAPWEIEGTTKKGNPHIITAGKKGWVIAEVTNQELGGKYDLTEERSQANARLIAAAPDLLENAKYIDYAIGDKPAEDFEDEEIVIIQVTGKFIKDNYAAIAKATTHV